MKTSSEPAKMPGIASGSVTLRNAVSAARVEVGRRLHEAAGRSRSSATYSGSTMNGRKL